MTPTFECLYCDHHNDKPGDCCLWQQKGQEMTSGHEMNQYAQQGDADEWNDLPANGEGWDKPSSVDVSKPYRPSNGSEGEAFMSHFCSNCKNDNDGQCDIAFNAMLFSIGEPEYPKEWMRIDGSPTCTAFDAKPR